MSRDSFWDKKVAEYLLINLERDSKNQFSSDYFTALHSLITYKEVELINRIILKELRKIADGNLTGGKKIVLKSQSRRKRYKSAEIFDFSRLEETEGDLKRAILADDDWGREIAPLVVSIQPVRMAVLDKIKSLLSKKLNSKKQSPLEAHAKSVALIFNLNKIEEDLIILFYLVENDRKLCNFFDEIGLDFSEFNKSARTFFRFFNYKPHELRFLLNKDSTLVRAGILKRRGSSLEISSKIASYLAGVGEEDILSSFFTKVKRPTFLGSDDFQVTKEMVSSCLDLVKSNRGVNILLHGEPGAGKTEFSKYLGKELGLEVYFIKQNDEEGDENLSFRKSGIVAAQNVLDHKNAIIVVDECDEIVNADGAFWNCEKDSGDKKAWINFLLENSKHNIIWISNRTDGIDDSTKRRFSYSLEFTSFTTKQRMKVWETIIQNEKIDYITKDQIELFANKFRVNAGGIALAVKDVQAMNHLSTQEEKINKINSLLMQHQDFVFGDKVDLAAINPNYRLDVLNCDMDMPVVLKNVKKFLEYTSDKSNTDIQNMNFLLQGPPGTGKTEFVKFLAKSVGQELLVKRLSDIRSKWYGENLKNIAAIFKQANSEGKILFLDEADSFFMNRETSSEHYIAETNELLTQMENFKGILICATNFSTAMDQASMRRFNFKIKFDYLNNDGKVNMFKFQFRKFLNRDLTNEIENRIVGIRHLTPGDFKVVLQKNAFNDEMTPEVLIEQLEKEVGYKKITTKQIGLMQ